jgi:methylthioribose-1-phosphate isomerase
MKLPESGKLEKLENIRLSENHDSVIILDQSLLPNQVVYRELRSPAEMHDALLTLKVRGAPAIGIFAAYALYVVGIEHAEYIKSARPTAVNLAWAADRMARAADLRAECHAIHAEDIAVCRAIAENGLALLRDGDCVMTYCNAGPLATSQYGTGLGALILGAERGMRLGAYVCETRPLLQGARITALELLGAGVDTTLICDNMASAVMSSGRIKAVFTGCDRVAANGDVANKIGTSGLAILARHYGIPFYVFAPPSTLDPSCKSGADIVIEQRSPDEITSAYFAAPVAPAGVKCFNPSFDVTPAALITAIVTEQSEQR